MNRSLVDILLCPICRVGLELISPQAENDQITDGSLYCAQCGRYFPINGGIPRMVVQPDHIAQKTMKSFGWQWNTFRELDPVFEEYFLKYYIAPLKPDFFRNKKGIEIGCGNGRFLRYSAQYGAKMVGIDISGAVDAAYQNTRDFGDIDIIQADIYSLPLQIGTFDFAYSIGVLHHLPRPEEGFKAMVNIVKEGGAVIVWVYYDNNQQTNSYYKPFFFLRRLTVHMPMRFLYALCFIMAIMERLFIHYPFRILRRFAFLKKIDQFIPFKYHANAAFRILHTDWFDRLSVPVYERYKRDDITGWFQRAGLTGCVISDPWEGRAMAYKKSR